MSCGGVGNEKVADETVKELIAGLKASVEEKAGSSFETFEAVSYATQVVAGTNYFVKVNVGGDAHIHVRVFKPLPHTGEAAQVVAVQTGKSATDAIAHF